MFNFFTTKLNGTNESNIISLNLYINTLFYVKHLTINRLAFIDGLDYQLTLQSYVFTVYCWETCNHSTLASFSDAD